MKNIFIHVLVISIVFFNWKANGQEELVNPDSVKSVQKAIFKVVALESAYYAGAMFVMQKTWYNNSKIVPFHFYNDNRGYLQVDKFGHAYGAYIESYIGYHCLLEVGVSRNNALIYGSTLGFILQMPVEIMDGIHEGWGFSWGDIVANAFGTVLFASQELWFNEQIVQYKFSYHESSYARNANGYFGKTALDHMLNDYNGHTYWFSMPFNRIVRNDKIPDWLNISAGYGANGMYGEFENISHYRGVPVPEAIRYRQYLLSLDINWTKIESNSKLLKIVFAGLNFIKLPFPTLEYNSMGKVKGYWLYF